MEVEFFQALHMQTHTQHVSERPHGLALLFSHGFSASQPLSAPQHWRWEAASSFPTLLCPLASCEAPAAMALVGDARRGIDLAFLFLGMSSKMAESRLGSQLPRRRRLLTACTAQDGGGPLLRSQRR